MFGVGLASLLSFSRLLRDAIYPLIVVIQLVPKIAWTPLFIVWVGIGWQSRLTIATFIGFFPIFIAMMAGLEVDRPVPGAAVPRPDGHAVADLLAGPAAGLDALPLRRAEDRHHARR